MTEKDLDIAIEKCERIMEFDTRTLENPESENGHIFEKVYDLLQFLRQLQFSTNAISVVRCRECKRWDKYHNKQIGECKWTFRVTKAEGYCNYGEQKDGEAHD